MTKIVVYRRLPSRRKTLADHVIVIDDRATFNTHDRGETWQQDMQDFHQWNINGGNYTENCNPIAESYVVRFHLWMRRNLLTKKVKR